MPRYSEIGGGEVRGRTNSNVIRKLLQGDVSFCGSKEDFEFEWTRSKASRM